jgi:hypothetical protein
VISHRFDSNTESSIRTIDRTPRRWIIELWPEGWEPSSISHPHTSLTADRRPLCHFRSAVFVPGSGCVVATGRDPPAIGACAILPAPGGLLRARERSVRMGRTRTPKRLAASDALVVERPYFPQGADGIRSTLDPKHATLLSQPVSRSVNHSRRLLPRCSRRVQTEYRRATCP